MGFQKLLPLAIGLTLISLFLVAACGGGQAFPPPEPETTTLALGEAQAQGLVQVEIAGAGLEEIKLSLKSMSDDPLEVAILPGTKFEAQSAGVQDMVVRQEKVVSLEPRDEWDGYVSVACVNMELDVPDESDTFTISSSPVSEDLVKLLNLSDFHAEPFRVQQFAIWTITDNPARGEYVGIGSFGFGTGPDNEEMEKIRQLFEKAGITTDKYRALRSVATRVPPTTPTSSPSDLGGLSVGTTLTLGPAEAHIIGVAEPLTTPLSRQSPRAGKKFVLVELRINKLESGKGFAVNHLVLENASGQQYPLGILYEEAPERKREVNVGDGEITMFQTGIELGLFFEVSQNENPDMLELGYR